MYKGDVKEKVAAKKQYERAKKKGQSAGQVAKQLRVLKLSNSVVDNMLSNQSQVLLYN